MLVSRLAGVIDRRILVNYRVDPEILANQLPKPFRPKLHRGYGVAGICLIRLRQSRPHFLPRFLGLSSENAAHRIAVEWVENGQTREGVYVPRRDTDSWINHNVGGRLFSGIYSRASFQVEETDTRLAVFLKSLDGETEVEVVGDLTQELPKDSIFESLQQASDFFEGGSLGYSATPNPRSFQGIELVCKTWSMGALAVSKVHSSFFDKRESFPVGSIAFDNALVMRGIEHEWRARTDLCCAAV